MMQKNSKKQNKLKVVRSAPSAISEIRRNVLPRMNGRVSQSIKLARRELVGTVTNGSTYTFMTTEASTTTPGYDLSPSNPIMFPWAASLATSFEKFRFDRLRLELVSSQPSTTAGRVYLAVDPDWDDAVPTDKATLAGLMCSVSGGVWETIGLDVPCASFNQGIAWRYCNVALRESPEPRTAYMGFVVVGIDAPTTCTWDLWVDYEVTLDIPTSERASSASIAGTWQSPGPTGSGVKFTGTQPSPLPIRDMSAVLGHYQSPGYPQDILEIPASRRGTINVATVLEQSSISPQTAIWTNKLKTNLQCLDAAGNILGTADESKSWVERVVGVLNESAAITQTGLAARDSITFRLQDLLAEYPTAKYILPYLSALSWLGFGSNKWMKLKYEL